MINADGGTRTAAITAAFVAVADAVRRQFGDLARSILRDSVAAVSAGIVAGEPVLDLDYPEDSRPRSTSTSSGSAAAAWSKCRGPAKGASSPRQRAPALLDLAEAGIDRLSTAPARGMGADWPLAD